MPAAIRWSRHMGAAGSGRLYSALANHGGVVRWASVAIIVISGLLLMRAAPSERLAEFTQDYLNDKGAWAPLALGLIYIVAALLFIPGWVLTMAAGALFGVVGGTIVVSLASTTSAALAFLIARYAARETFRRRIEHSPQLVAFDEAIGAQGWRVVALLRLSPAVPFNLQNYLYGVTSIRFWPCVLASWVTMLPGTIMYVYLGALGRSATDRSASWLEWLLRAVGLLATIVVTIYVSRLARVAIRKQTRIVGDSQLEGEQSSVNHSDARQVSPEGTSTPRSVVATVLTMMLAVAAMVLAGWATMRPTTVRQAADEWLGVPTPVQAVNAKE